MRVDSHNTEFGYELIATLPYAYWLHKNNMLSGTISGPGSEPYYFFSPKHEINRSPRDFANTSTAAKVIPNMWIHKNRLDKSRWEPPPLKKQYQHQAILFDKPTVVVYNRYNKEWGKPPINYFDLPALRRIFSCLSGSYSVVYFNVRGEESLEDNAHSMELGDYEMIRKEFPDVRIIHDIVRQFSSDYNTTQLRVFAGCDKFITMNGAPSILASYFGGENMIYSKECRELSSSVNSFFNWYPDFGGSHIRLFNSTTDLISAIDRMWVKKHPLLNVLIRCHDRPKGLDRALAPLMEKPEIRVICSYDNDNTWKYLSKKRVEKVAVVPLAPQKQPPGDDYKNPIPANLYFNEMYKRITGGYVMFLDDDDEAVDADRILSLCEEDKVLLWRVQSRTGALVPSDENMGRIVAGDISGIGVCFHSKYLHLAQWEPWRRGDYRVIRSLVSRVEPKWTQGVFTKMSKRIDGMPKADLMKQRIAEVKKRADELAIEVARRAEENKKIANGSGLQPFLQRRREWTRNRRNRLP